MKNGIVLLCLISTAACRQPAAPAKTADSDSLRQVLLQTDRAFSDQSYETGRNASFLEFMHEQVTMLQPNSMPLISRDTMKAVYARRPDTAFTLTWEPLFADVAASGELGYTYGIWKLSSAGGDSSKGTYCTIWKLDENGEWKFVLDTGNEGLKPQQP